MIPVLQTEPDNCFQAALASILEISIEDVPAYKENMPDNEKGMLEYLDILNDTFLFRFNIWLISVQYPDNIHYPKGYSIKDDRVIKGKRKGILHARVALDGIIVHDPFDEERVYSQDNHYYVFCYINPAAV